MKPSPAGRLLAALPVFGFAAYPVVFLAGVNAGALPIDSGALVRSLIVAFGAAAALLLAASAARWEFQARAAWTAMVLLVCAFYQPLLLVVGLGMGRRIAPDSALTATIFVAGAGLFVAGLVRPWQERARSPLALNAALVLLLGINLQAAVSKIMSDGSDLWASAVDEYVSDVASRQTVGRPERDIYYIVLDGFGRPDVLQSHYGLDLTSFVAFLTERGFEVPALARSNYAQTYLSLASTLNLSYLDRLASAIGPTSTDRRPLAAMIDGNALMTAAKRTGYKVFVVGSTYAATQQIRAAEVCLCVRAGPTEFEHEALVSTPLAALPAVRRMYDRHRDSVLHAFDAIEELSRAPGPKFVFAHVISPHPPFVLDASGHAKQPQRPFNFRDGDHYDGNPAEYVEGYRSQAQYLTSRLKTLIERVTAPSGAAPAIVIHGDHGPGSRLRWGSAQDSDLNERLSIFAAYAFPGETAAPLPAGTTPITGATILAERYLGVAAGPLRDASYFSTWNEPYRFVPPHGDDESTEGGLAKRTAR